MGEGSEGHLRQFAEYTPSRRIAEKVAENCEILRTSIFPPPLPGPRRIPLISVRYV